jgi:hypothetical protein
VPPTYSVTSPRGVKKRNAGSVSMERTYDSPIFSTPMAPWFTFSAVDSIVSVTAEPARVA